MNRLNKNETSEPTVVVTPAMVAAGLERAHELAGEPDKAYVIEAISKQDFAVVRSMVFVGSLLYIATFALIDIAYTWVDPRVRLS